MLPAKRKWNDTNKCRYPIDWRSGDNLCYNKEKIKFMRNRIVYVLFVFTAFVISGSSFTCYGKRLKKRYAIKKTDNKIELVGNWFIPHCAVINITFRGDSTFVFNDYNMKKDMDEKLSGTYHLQKGYIVLKYEDRPAQRFFYHKGKGADTNYYITKGSSYYFVKSE